MLGYEWGSHSSSPPQLILTDDINHDPSSSSNHHRPIFHDPFSVPCTFPHHNNNTNNNDDPSPPPPSTSSNNNFSLYHFPTTDQHHQQTTFYHDPRAFSAASYSLAPSSFDATFASAQTGPTRYPLLMPKSEPDYISQIGLNLGGRTYFANDDDLVSRLYRRSRPAEPLNSPKCQAEGCNADLSTAKHYHRRHKVCEFHSKASTVIAAGITQRFCQQCSRFHQLTEFDNGKRSCRKRLADHNRRRRKSNQTNAHDHRTTSSQSEKAENSPSQRSPQDSGANSWSSVTVAISPSRVSFDSSFKQRLYE